MKEQVNINFLYENIKRIVYKPYEFDEEAALLFNKENIYSKENIEKLNTIILDYRRSFQELIKKNSTFDLSFDDKSIVALDLLLSDFYKMNFIDALEEDELNVQRFITKWVGYIGSYLLFYIKKQLRVNPKIQYPIYDSYFQVNGEKIFPYFVAMKKLSIDMSMNFYEYLNELFAYVNDEDFKLNIDYIDELKIELRPFLVKWFLNN